MVGNWSFLLLLQVSIHPAMLVNIVVLEVVVVW